MKAYEAELCIDVPNMYFFVIIEPFAYIIIKFGIQKVFRIVFDTTSTSDLLVPLRLYGSSDEVILTSTHMTQPNAGCIEV